MYLNRREQQILDFITEQTGQNGYPPTIREIADAVNLRSTGDVHRHLKSLEDKGVVRRDPRKPRAITVL